MAISISMAISMAISMEKFKAISISNSNTRGMLSFIC
jgi:hypothetical protein